MHWIDWVVIGLSALGALITISQIGESRKPIEPGTAIVSVLLNAGVIIALILTHQGGC